MFFQKILMQYLSAIVLFLGLSAVLGTAFPTIGQQATQPIMTSQTTSY